MIDKIRNLLSLVLMILILNQAVTLCPFELRGNFHEIFLHGLLPMQVASFYMKEYFSKK